MIVIRFVGAAGFCFRFGISIPPKGIVRGTTGFDKEAKDRGGDPDEHWLRKMPDETKPWRYREKAVKYLTRALREFERKVGR